MGATVRWFKSLIVGKRHKSISNADQDNLRASNNTKSKRWISFKFGHTTKLRKEEDNKQKQNFYSESARFLYSHNFSYLYASEACKMHWAALKIQCVFRGFLARRALKALKAIVRIQAIFRGRRVRQLVNLSHCFSNRCFVQETKREWCDSQGSLEEVKARQQQRHAAAVRRERAMAYAMYHRAMAASQGSEFWQAWEKEALNQEVDSFEHQQHHHHYNSMKQCHGRSRDPSPTKRYMEDTISMKAKSKSLAKSKWQNPQSYTRRRHSSISSLDCIDNNQHYLMSNTSILY